MDHVSSPWLRSAAAAVLSCVLLVVLADWLFYEQPVGWTTGLYALVLLGLIVSRRPAALRRRGSRAILVACAGLSVACIVEPGPIAVTLLLIGVPMLVATTLQGWTSSPVIIAARVGDLFRRVPAQLPRDLARHRRRRRGAGAPRGLRRQLRRSGVPLAWTAAFLALLAFANPVIARALDDLRVTGRDAIERFADIVAPGRIVLWLAVAVLAWGWLRARSCVRRRACVLSEQIDERQPGVDVPAVVVRTLVLLNALFLVQTVLDAMYLVGGVALPEGMTYAEYAHRGAYPLVATALLAAVFVLVTFRRGAFSPRLRLARLLVSVWIGQNILLLATSAWRLGLYVDAYGLTRLRVAAGIWMVLVGVGLVSIVYRLLRRRSNAWLLRVNTAVLCAVLYACAFPDFRGFIAGWNVTHCREVTGTGAPLDLAYLEKLGPAALPALALLGDENGSLATTAIPHRKRLVASLEAKTENWRGWTWRRSQIKASLAR